MKLMNERAQVKNAIKRFVAQWGNGTYIADKRGIDVGARLQELDLETATARQVAKLIGNSSWAKPKTCGECETKTWNIVEIGEKPTYDSATAYLCRSCLLKAVALIDQQL